MFILFSMRVALCVRSLLCVFSWAISRLSLTNLSVLFLRLVPLIGFVSNSSEYGYAGSRFLHVETTFPWMHSSSLFFSESPYRVKGHNNSPGRVVSWRLRTFFYPGLVLQTFSRLVRALPCCGRVYRVSYPPVRYDLGGH